LTSRAPVATAIGALGALFDGYGTIPRGLRATHRCS